MSGMTAKDAIEGWQHVAEALRRSMFRIGPDGSLIPPSEPIDRRVPMSAALRRAIWRAGLR